METDEQRAKRLAYGREYYHKNAEKERERSYRYRTTHAEERAAKNKEYKKKNNARILGNMKAYYAANKESFSKRNKLRYIEKKTEMEEYRALPLSRFRETKRKAKTRKIEFNLTLEQFAHEIMKPCTYCSNQLGTPSKTGAGLDRMDNSKGYTFNNICSCCGVCNSIKNKHLSYDETKAAAAAIIAVRQARLASHQPS
jgi:hypothetical protein